MTKQEVFLQSKHPVFYNAARNHRTHKNEMLDFVIYPYLRQVYLDENGSDTMKSTQSGFTEWLIALSFALAERGKQIFYVLPTIELVGRFVKNRFNKSVDHSAYYTSILDNNPPKASDHIHLKHIEDGAIAFVGSNSSAGFTEYPADVLIVDEEDECDQSNLEMSVERLSNSEDRRQFRVSNPTILKYGIHARWLESSQDFWHVKADCGHYVYPDPFKVLLRRVEENEYVIRDNNFEWDSSADIRLNCDKCGKPFDRFGEGHWVRTFQGKRTGRQINKLFSSKVTLREIVQRFDKGLSNDEVMQRVYNADFGLAYTAEGANLTDSSLDRCVDDFLMTNDYHDSACVLGADVGTLIHVKISSILEDGKLRARFIGSVRTEEEFNELFDCYNVIAGVIDAQPERRMSERLCNKHKGLFRCYYGSNKQDNVQLDDKIITVNRTAALDNVKESILTKRILLPKNASNIPEYYEHMTSSTRVLKKDGKEYEWVETGPDHLFHASGYELIAKSLIMRLS